MKRLLTGLMMGFASLALVAQSPENFNYQAVLRDNSGSLLQNQTVTVRVGIYDGNSLSYEEDHSVSTDQYGLVNLKIGDGAVNTGTFSNLDWSQNQYEIKVEVDNGNGFQNLGQEPLSSVPYALHSASSDPGALNDLNDVNASSPSNNEVLKFNGTDWVPGTDNTGGGSAWSSSGNTVYYNAGNVGIGTSSPSESLEVNGNIKLGDTLHFGSAEYMLDAGFNEIGFNGSLIPTASFGIDLGNSSNYWERSFSEEVYMDEIKDGPAQSNYLDIEPDTLKFGSAEYMFDAGPYEVGFNADLMPLTDNNRDLGGSSDRWDDVYATNGTIQTSDRRSKKDITDLDYGLEEVMAIRPVKFYWKDKKQDKPKIGVIAQQIQPILNEVVKTHDWKEAEDGTVQKVKNERLGVYYADMIPVLIKAIQEQQQQIEQLENQKAEIKELRKELQSLKSEIQNLK